MKVNGSHEQHPQRHSHNAESELPPNARIPLVRRSSAFRLDPSALDRPIAHDDGSVISVARDIQARPDDDPGHLLKKKAAPEDE